MVAPHRLRRLVSWLSFAVALAATPAWAKPVVVAPTKQSRKERKQARREGDLSEAGTRRGILEISLGGVTAAGAGALVGRGIWELLRGRSLVRECASFDSEAPECLDRDPALGHKIAGGLSLGFAVPMAIASGFLFAYGLKIRRDYKAYKRDNPTLSLLPAASRRGASLDLVLRF